MEQMLTVPDVATILRLDPETIRRLIRKGQLPAVKFGNTYRIRPADAEALTTPAQRPQSPRNQRDRIRQMLRAS